MSLRVLHILDHSLPLQSGYAFRTLALLREQRALGWETFQLTTPKHYVPAPDEEDVAGLHFYRTNVAPTWLRRAPVLNAATVVTDTARRIDSVFDRVQPDVVHAHSPCLNGLAALRAVRGRGVPVVYEMRASWEDAAVDHGVTREGSVRYRLSRALETYVLKRVDAITTICNGLASDIAVRGIGRDRITIIPNAVDIEQFAVIDRADEGLRAELGLGDGPVLGFAGSFYAYEGLDLLLQAMPTVLRAWPNASVVLVGGGPAEAPLKKLAAELGIARQVRFVGRVPHEQVRRYYSVIDLLAYPRKSMRLTELVTPLKPLEAMALGRMFVASDVGGHRELIPQRLHGQLFAAGDAEALARVALGMLASRGAWPKIAADSRDYVSTSCTWRLSASRYKDVYAAVTKRPPAVRSTHGATSV